jgi:murein DD-endopeptidase MepM/ murein hydrolase activator NlpD
MNSYNLLSVFLFAFILQFTSASNPKFILSWPTPNPAFAKGLGYSTFLQKTGPEKSFSSGSFGCVRNNGYKFHEGLDLYPVNRDKSGKAKDSVFSAMSGTVTYINSNASHSAYGKYIVIEHFSVNPALYTLYAHLDSIEQNLKVGTKVKAAQAIAKMGNTSSGYRIPLERSHLHFEIGLRLTDNFQAWYNRKSFKTKNRHGNFSGFNLVGIDPLAFYGNYKNKSFEEPVDFLNSLPTVAVVRVKSSSKPNFLSRYPSLCEENPDKLNGWDISFGPFGIPLKMKAVKQTIPATENKFRITSFNSDLQKDPCRKLVLSKGHHLYPSEQLKTYLELIFNL